MTGRSLVPAPSDQTGTQPISVTKGNQVFNLDLAKIVCIKASGDYVELENPNGRRSNRVRVRVTQRIRPDSVFIVHGFGHTDRRQRLAHGVGADDADLMHNVKLDPIAGSTGMRASFVTLVKTGGVS